MNKSIETVVGKLTEVTDDIQESISLSNIDTSNSIPLLKYMKELAKEFDNILLEKHKEYSSRYSQIERYIDGSIQCLEKE